MTVEQMEIPVAEMETEAIETEYALTPDGTVVEAEDFKENAESFSEAVQ
jgi:hypothetical protein